MQQANQRPAATPGFAIEIAENTELGPAMLIADLGDGQYQPINVVTTLREAREFTAGDMHRRMRDLDAGKEPACPESYLVWAPRDERRIPRS